MPSARISNTTPHTTYRMWVTAKNAIGEGETAGPVSAQFNGCTAAEFDEDASTGATFTTLDDPDGDGKNYRLASFNDSGSLVIATEGKMQYLVVGAGGGVGNINAPWTSSGGGGGGGHTQGEIHVSETTYPVKVGGAVNGTGPYSAFDSIIAVGGGGGSGGAWANGGGGQGYGSGAGGSSAYPEQGGYKGGNGYPGTTYGGGGGGGGATQNGANGILEGPGGKGGDGFTTTFAGGTITLCGGGGGGNGGAGGAGGGGAGNGNNGTPNTGGGGGGLRGNGADRLGGKGGSGVVYLRVEI